MAVNGVVLYSQKEMKQEEEEEKKKKKKKKQKQEERKETMSCMRTVSYNALYFDPRDKIPYTFVNSQKIFVSFMNDIPKHAFDRHVATDAQPRLNGARDGLVQLGDTFTENGTRIFVAGFLLHRGLSRRERGIQRSFDPARTSNIELFQHRRKLRVDTHPAFPCHPVQHALKFRERRVVGVAFMFGSSRDATKAFMTSAWGAASDAAVVDAEEPIIVFGIDAYYCFRNRCFSDARKNIPTINQPNSV